jgi:hypothetical protein
LPLSLLWACSGPAEIPDTPDLSELDARYDEPTAALDAPAVGNVLDRMPRLRDLATGFRAAGYATDGVDRAGESAEERRGVGMRIQGSVRVTLRCPGEGRVYDEDVNGKIELTIAVAESRIQRAVGGMATRCVLLGGEGVIPVRVEVHGPFAFDLGRDLGLRERFAGRLLMSLGGEIHVGDAVYRNLSARWTNTQLEYLYELEDGTTVVAELGLAGIRVRDRDTVWGCLGGEQCEEE